MKANIFDLMRNKVNGTTFISFDSETTVKVRKTLPEDRKQPNPYYDAVSKVNKGSRVMVFQNKHTNAYESMVERRLAKEGKDPSSFELSPRTWGTRIPETPFIEHKGKYYLEVIFLGSNPAEYFMGGKQIGKDEIIGLTPSKEGEQGGLDNKVIIRTFAIENITRLTIDKQTYTDLYFKVE